MMQSRAEAGLLDAMGAYLHHDAMGLSPEIEGHQCADRRNHLCGRAVDGTRNLDSVLAQRLNMGGDTFSMAYITAFAGWDLQISLRYLSLADTNRLKFWQARVGECASVCG